ncbi:DUF6443 domain-containing protein [Flavobacterium sp.]|uniref:DUF6443 domain-containing protein n=1 Tax=Flavobacterium sp. TaxID=239 RepID=UPI00262DF7BB|nr:DUF6443 domain-containing protein [Flavobacterium sp.]
MKRFIYIYSLVFVNLIYSQFTQNIPYQNFIGHNQGGGNQSVVTINSSSISISFNTYFNATNIQNKYVATLNYTGNLPDMTLGPIQNTSYRILIISKKVYIVSDINESVTFLSGTISSNLTGFVPISSADIKTINTVGENFIREIVYLTDQGDSGLKQISTTFFDGLGRPKQTIEHQQSTSGKNIVQHFEYDVLGRQTKEFLPYVSSNNDLNIESNSLTNTLNFYNSPTLALTGDPNFQSTQFPYSEKDLDKSPLNRVLKQSAPGNSWAMGSSHEIRLDYLTNTSTENIYKFKANATWNIATGIYEITLTQNGIYSDGQLFKNVTKNENWTSGNDNTTHNFTNKDGQLILKRDFENNVPHDTYYVYDMYGNLTYVIPPKVETNTWGSSTVVNDLCYQYKYDEKNRLVEKKLPGKQWEFIVYDKLNRIVATGPTFSPFVNSSDNAIGWMITKYDKLNRVVYTGWKEETSITSLSRASLQSTYSSSSTSILSEEKQASTMIDNVSVHYSNNVAPTAFKILGVNYYDDYNFPNAPVIPNTILNNNSQNVYYDNNTKKPKGSATASWVRVLQNDSDINFEKTYTLYDFKNRPVRVYNSNYLGGYTQSDSKIDFIGKTIFSETKHKKTSTDNEILIKNDFTYNNQNRLLTHFHTINGGTPQLMSDNTYSELGQLITKKVGRTVALPLQKIDYRYNIRGWLTSINDINDLRLTTENDLFAFMLNYDSVKDVNGYTGVPLYNGNVSEVYWRTKSDNVKRKYGFQYDNLNRLKNAIFQKPDINVTTNSYNESLTYDKNGNILSLQRYGAYEDNVFNFMIDNLNYSYDNNRLMKVTDLTNVGIGFKDDSDGTNDTTNDYTYDLNGNLKTDENKTITNIKYNHLNLPVTITFVGTNRNIKYLYNSFGKKVKKTVTTGSTIVVTDYLDSFQYTNNVLNFFPTNEGYVQNTVVNGQNTYNYVFNYLDHLGNVRLSYSLNPQNSTLTILEENHYYPFGLKHSGYNMDRRQYVDAQGATIKPCTNCSLGYNFKVTVKEWQNELNLNLYDFGARNYDPAIGRWMNIDPLAEKYFDLSTYNYVKNSPNNSFDPDGMDVYLLTEEGKTILALKEKNSKEDTLYAVKNGSANPINGKKPEPSLFDIKDTNKDGKYNVDDGVTVKSGLIGQLTKSSGKNSSGDYTISVARQNGNEDDYLSLFKYISDNAMKSEFSLQYYTKDNQNWMQLGTYFLNAESPSVIAKNGRITKSYHNHSDTVGSQIVEFGQIGANRDGSYLYTGQRSDFHRSIENNVDYTKYVYYANSRNLYSVTKYTVKYIQKINSVNDLKL